MMRGPSPMHTAPAFVNAPISLSVIPPSGPNTKSNFSPSETSKSDFARADFSPSFAASSYATKTLSYSAKLFTKLFLSATRFMLGTILRLLCSAAPCTTFSSFSASLASFLPSHLTIDLSAGKPHISAAPSSVAFCAMVANLSPLGKPHAIAI